MMETAMPRAKRGDRAEYDRAYRAINKERIDAYGAEWRLQNKERLKERHARRRLEKRAMCLIAGARVRCRNKGIVFALDGFAEELQRRIDLGRCELSGAPFDLSPGRKANSPSLDRRDPALGYTPENVRVVCHAMNTALGDWGEDSLAPIMEGWLRSRASVTELAA